MSNADIVCELRELANYCKNSGGLAREASICERAVAEIERLRPLAELGELVAVEDRKNPLDPPPAPGVA